jgi:hypothetical protein
LFHTPSLSWYLSASGTSGHAAHTTHARHPAEVHAAAEHLRKDVVNVGISTATAASAWVERRHPVGVIEVSLVIIVKDFIRLFRSFESNFGFCAVIFCDFVGVMC